MAKWSLDLTKYAKKQKVAIQEVRKAYAFALYSSIVKNTPSGNPDFDQSSGRAKANWNVSVGSPDYSTTEKTMPPEQLKKVPDVKGDESIFISNSLPYITTLEYGGYPKSPKKGSRTRPGIKPARYEIMSQNGYSKKAPEGMVGKTLANNENIFNAAVRKIKGNV